ncbi:hypothetical protein KGF54_004338 [Candida jiufengensis]|uniref:uncharacterized protein n=1 Tax=Candida jiufengensis TaxID=497108 RepID=UPI00222592F4|nr:uncharacterized protein KGF54_004338 [Candida jiufengensis]KAI5951264.1 hypothetical protein KGF54_004338 [Candida jiufengensis]
MSSVARSSEERQQPPRKKRRGSQNRVVDITSEIECRNNSIINDNNVIDLDSQRRESLSSNHDDDIQILAVNENNPTLANSIRRPFTNFTHNDFINRRISGNEVNRDTGGSERRQRIGTNSNNSIDHTRRIRGDGGNRVNSSSTSRINHSRGQRSSNNPDSGFGRGEVRFDEGEDDDIEILDVREASEPLRSQISHIHTPHGPFMFEEGGPPHFHHYHDYNDNYGPNSYEELPYPIHHSSNTSTPPPSQRNLRSNRPSSQIELQQQRQRQHQQHRIQQQRQQNQQSQQARNTGRRGRFSRPNNLPRERNHHTISGTINGRHFSQTADPMIRLFVSRSLERISQLEFHLGGVSSGSSTSDEFDFDDMEYDEYDEEEIMNRAIMRRIEEDNNRSLNARSERETNFNKKALLEKKQLSDSLDKLKTHTNKISSNDLLMCELCGVDLGEGAPEDFKSNTEYDKNFANYSKEFKIQAPWFCTNPFTQADIQLSKRIFASKCGHCFCGRCVKNIANRSKKLAKDAPRGSTIKNPTLFAPAKCPANECGKRFLSKAFTEVYF